MKPMTMTKLADLLLTFLDNHLQTEVVSTSTEEVTLSATVKSNPKEFVEFTSKLVQLCKETTPEIQIAKEKIVAVEEKSNTVPVFKAVDGGEVEYIQNDRPVTTERQFRNSDPLLRLPKEYLVHMIDKLAEYVGKPGYRAVSIPDVDGQTKDWKIVSEPNIS